MAMRARWRLLALHHGCALVSVAAAVGLRRVIAPWLHVSLPLDPVFIAVLLTAWVGGIKPALTAAVLGGLASGYGPLWSLGSWNADQTGPAGLPLYLLTAVVVAVVGGLMHRACRAAEADAATLQARNENLEKSLQKGADELQSKAQALESQSTAQRACEAQLRLLETCVNQLDDIVLVTEAEPQESSEPRITYVNDAFVRRTGYTREEVVGKSLRFLQGAKTDDAEVSRIYAALRALKPARVEVVNCKKTGEDFWLDLDIVPVADAAGCVRHWVAVERDLSKHLLAEEKAARLAAIVQSSDDAIIGKNLDGIVTSWNGGAERIFGYTAQEMVGQPILRLIPKERHHEEQEILAKIRRGESIQHFVTIRQRKDGGTLEVSVTTSPIKDSAGRIIGVSKVARDMTERSLAAKTIRENEQRLQLALQAGGMGTYEINLLSGEAHWNSVEYELLGLKPGEVTPGPETFFRFVHPDDLEALSEAWEDALRTGEFAAEFRVRHPDGKERWLAGRGRFASREPDNLQPPSRFFGVNFDITERVNAQQLIRASRDRMRLAMEATGVGIWEWNLANNEVRWDDQMFRIYGIDPTPDGLVTYELWRSTVMPEDLDPQEIILQETIRRLGHSKREFRILRAGDGECRHIQAVERVGLNTQGQAAWLVGTNLDITERKQLEARMYESEERFRTMANSMSQLAWIARADGFIVWYNQRWYEYTGTTPAQMEGWGWQSVHDPATLPKVMERWQSAIASGKPFDMEFPLRGADGTFRNFLTRGQPLKDAAGRVMQWYGTNTDVTDLKLAEEKIRQLNAGLEQRVLERTSQLEAANKELEAFSYSVSHDLRAPLRAVNGFAGMVLSQFGEQLPEAGRHYLERIQQGGLRMGALIDDLLAFSRLNRQSISTQPVDVCALVQSAWEDLRHQRDGREIKLQVADLLSCQGDSALLKQVWINLLSNAVKYTRGRAPAIIEVGSRREKDEMIYHVRDNGAGFEMQYVHKLFGVFQRLHRSDEFEGSGVGLAIVQRVIQRHGGRVWAEGELNRGATFSFTLKETKP